jgi:Leucine-rich repeat (LRR) protein
MANPRVEVREDGLRWLVVTDGWSRALTDLVDSGKVDGVELNSAKGTWDDSLNFLEDIPELRHLILIDLAAKDVRSIQGLSQLETLNLSAYATSPLDFSWLPNLKTAFVEWRRSYRNLSACIGLEDLYLNRYSEQSLLVVKPMRQMVRLRVGDSRTLSTLDGITDLTRLRTIGLYGLPRLHNLELLPALAGSLEVVDLNQCRYLSTVDPLAELKQLKRLVLVDCGRVPSVRAVADCRTLRQFFFYGDTNVVDGDLEFLRRMPLSDVAFKNRRHYSVRREELPAWEP